jgi:hypothetical protein
MIQVRVSLEMSHSWWRVGVLYLVGVLSGNTLPDSPEPVFINIVLNDAGWSKPGDEPLLVAGGSTLPSGSPFRKHTTRLT